MSLSLSQRLVDLAQIQASLSATTNLEEKIRLLSSEQDFLQHSPSLCDFMDGAGVKAKLVIKAIAAIGEGPIVFRGFDGSRKAIEQLQALVEALWEVETFYDAIGGIVGYHCKVLELIAQQESSSLFVDTSEHYEKPYAYRLNSSVEPRDRYAQWGIQHLPEMAELYPVGGAGERLNLQDPDTGEPLPVALLRFGGRTLLEGLIRDLQAREYLYYKLEGRQLTTPILMMTSLSKNNHQRIQSLCEENYWFGRGKEAFFFFVQPQAPVITAEGHWSMQAPLVPTLKPGGHGVIWKLAKDHGAFRWLEKQNRTKALLRQINNPVAGTDLGLLAFTGIGCHEDKAFGFASCPRRVNTAEGMDVLVETAKEGQYTYRISNIEYTDFAKRGIEDKPEEFGSSYSKFPTNTNILFADLKAVEEALAKNPFPGAIINMKKRAPFYNASGEFSEIPAGRLECMMQNIADVIVDRSPEPLEGEALRGLKTFLTYNDRSKTISVTKEALTPDKKVLMETPEGCFYEVLKNLRALLHDECGMDLPEIGFAESYRKEGPCVMLQLHPALGPFYSIIRQKIQGGKLHHGAELQLEIAELAMENLILDGSLLVRAESPMGSVTNDGILVYGDNGGKCFLRNVTINNKGINRQSPNVFWRNEIVRHEQLEIVLEGNGEFVAEGITFTGTHHIFVPDGYRVTAYQEEGAVSFIKDKKIIKAPSWSWRYAFDPAGAINLVRTAEL